MTRQSHTIQLATLSLIGIGLIMIISAEVSVSQSESVLARVAGSKHLMFAAGAALAMLICSHINLRQVMRHRTVFNPLVFAYILSMVLCGLIFVPGMGANINGASRWLKLGPVMFQPSELLKWTSLLTIAWWCARQRGLMHNFWRGLFPALLLIGVSCLIIVIEDLGTAALIAMVGAVLLLAGGAKLWHLAMLIPPAAGALYAAIATSPYRLQRLLVFMDPYHDPQGSGYQPIQSLVAIAGGGVTGKGLGNGIQKHGYLPQDTSDFIFAVICSELGLAGAAVVVVLFAILLWTGIGIARNSRDLFGSMAAMAITLTVIIQACINMAVVTVVVPTKGIALPLLSAGGTGTIMVAAMLGLLASIDQEDYFWELSQQIDSDEMNDLDARAEEMDLDDGPFNGTNGPNGPNYIAPMPA